MDAPEGQGRVDVEPGTACTPLGSVSSATGAVAVASAGVGAAAPAGGEETVAAVSGGVVTAGAGGGVVAAAAAGGPAVGGDGEDLGVGWVRCVVGKGVEVGTYGDMLRLRGARGGGGRFVVGSSCCWGCWCVRLIRELVRQREAGALSTARSLYLSCVIHPRGCDTPASVASYKLADRALSRAATGSLIAFKPAPSPPTASGQAKHSLPRLHSRAVFCCSPEPSTLLTATDQPAQLSEPRVRDGTAEGPVRHWAGRDRGELG